MYLNRISMLLIVALISLFRVDVATAQTIPKSIQQGATHIGVVGMRVDRFTRMGAELELFLHSLEYPLLATLRDTQVYVQAAYLGLSLFDLPPSRAQQDLDDWKPVLAWLNRHRAGS